MSTRLTKHAHRPHDDDWPMPPINSYDGPAEKVTYLSTNNRDGRQFEAVVPPNSAHANKLAEIALLVQSNERHARSHRKPTAALRINENRISQTASSATQISAPLAQLPISAYVTAPREIHEVYESDTLARQVPTSSYDSSLSGQADTAPPLCTCSASPSAHEHVKSTGSGGEYQQFASGPLQQTPLPVTSQAVYSSYPHQTVSTQPMGQSPEVYRYGTEQQTGYRVVTETGEMRVSAPIGSSEAQAFDGVVERMSSKVRLSRDFSLHKLKHEYLDLVQLTMI